MARQKFDPGRDRRRPAKPLPETVDTPVKPHRPGTNGGVKMIDNLSVTWEPSWNEVLDELGVSRT